MPFTAYMLHLFHPKDSLTLIKRREGKNWIHAVLILLFVVIVRVFSVLFSSYLFSSNKDDINLLLEIAHADSHYFLLYHLLCSYFYS